jgi:hypothetical protein
LLGSELAHVFYAKQSSISRLHQPGAPLFHQPRPAIMSHVPGFDDPVAEPVGVLLKVGRAPG